MGKAFENFKRSLELSEALQRIEDNESQKIEDIKSNRDELSEALQRIEDNESQKIEVNEKLRIVEDNINKHNTAIMGLRGGQVVLMVASFEFFLRELFREEISSLNKVGIDFSKLPPALLVTSVFNGLNNAMAAPAFSSKDKTNEKIHRIPKIINECELLMNKQINPDSFTDTHSNPNPETVLKKFKEVGINEIFKNIKNTFEKNWKSVVSDEFIKETLFSIVNRRHLVAHTADIPNITKKDIEEAIRFLKVLAEVLEEALSAHINDLKVTAKKDI